VRCFATPLPNIFVRRRRGDSGFSRWGRLSQDGGDAIRPGNSSPFINHNRNATARGSLGIYSSLRLSRPIGRADRSIPRDRRCFPNLPRRRLLCSGSSSNASARLTCRALPCNRAESQRSTRTGSAVPPEIKGATRTRQYGHDNPSHHHHHFVLAWRRRLVWPGPLVLSQRRRGLFRSDAKVRAAGCRRSRYARRPLRFRPQSPC
jgi:hypothetical protein